MPLDLAVAASCAVPGILPTVTIGGRRYMDGGVRSVSNADLAQGYDSVIVIAPRGSADNPFDHNALGQLETGVAGLRAADSVLAMFLPDAEALAASRPNRMGVAFLRPAAEPGLRQARAVAGQVTAVWEL